MSLTKDLATLTRAELQAQYPDLDPDYARIVASLDPNAEGKPLGAVAATTMPAEARAAHARAKAAYEANGDRPPPVSASAPEQDLGDQVVAIMATQRGKALTQQAQELASVIAANQNLAALANLPAEPDASSYRRPEARELAGDIGDQVVAIMTARKATR